MNLADVMMNTLDGGVTVREVKEMFVLGVLLDRRISLGTSIEHNLTKGEGAYGHLSKLLKDKKAPCKERLEAWCRGPVGIAVFGVGGWALSRTNIHLLRRWEMNHIRAFLKLKRRSIDEANFEYNRRTNISIHSLFAKYGFTPI